jgi:hypothetical protein
VPAPGTSTTGDDDESSGSTGEPDGFQPDPDWEKVEIRFPDYDVPAQQTQYACVGFTLETDAIHNMVAFVPHVDDSTVTHHMVLHRTLDALGGDGVFDCFDMPGSIEVSWAWAPGVEPLVLPEEAGFVFGNEGAQTHYALQIHYDNPLEEGGHVDSSGVDIYVTDQLRPNRAGGYVLGTIDGLDIPPDESDWEVIATCDTSSLTGPINVFASFLHAHYLGRRLWTDHERGGEMLPKLGTADPYSFDSQTLEHMSTVVEPGDILTTHCIYDSTGVTGNTTFGLETADEMCFNYLLVYPVPLNPYCID